MLEPQSTALFVLLIALFGVLMWRTLATRRTAVRVLAACLAFVPAMVFGVLGVNKYYGYYQTWGAMVADGRDLLRVAPWISFAPGLAIGAAVLGFNLVGDALREAYDPRLRTER